MGLFCHVCVLCANPGSCVFQSALWNCGLNSLWWLWACCYHTTQKSVHPEEQQTKLQPQAYWLVPVAHAALSLRTGNQGWAPHVIEEDGVAGRQCGHC